MKPPRFPRRPSSLARRVAEACRALGRPRPGEGLLAAVSGGTDSAALLLLLAEAARAGLLDGPLAAAHLHHGLRGGDADGDRDFVAALAGALDLPFHHDRADVKARAVAEGIGIEEAGRRARTDFLCAVAAQTGAGAAATGHTLDDQAVTVLHRILRGTGLFGLAAILPLRPLDPDRGAVLVRPLLGIRRAALAAYLERRGVTPRRDASNDDPAYTRNRIRLEILPGLRAVNPRVEEALAALAQDSWLLRAPAGPGGSAPEGLLPGGLFDSPLADPAGRVREALRAAGGRPARLGRDHLRALRALEARGRGRVALPGAVEARAEGGGVRIGGGAGAASPPVRAVALPQGARVEAGPWILTVTEGSLPADVVAQARRGGEAVEHADAQAVSWPLRVRGRRPGDRFHPLGAPGTARLKEFLRASGVPEGERDAVPLVVDGRDRILWVVPFRIAHWAAVGPKTGRALRLTARRRPGT